MTNPKDNTPMLAPHALGFEKPKAPVDEEDIEEAQPEPDPVYVDPFVEEIDKIQRAQSPAVRDTINRAKCFGRSWNIDTDCDTDLDTEEGGICQQFECDLRGLCELVYQRANVTDLSQDKDEEPMTAAERFVAGRKKKPKSPDGKWERHPYVSSDRPVDKIAHELWVLVGSPPSMPNSWIYPPAKNKDQRVHAKRLFIDNYGGGTMVSRRIAFHTFFRDGAHWMRFWVRNPGGGWLDLSPALSSRVMKHTDLKLENCSTRVRKHQHRFFPYRVYISRQRHMNRLKKVFEAMGVVPQSSGDEPGGQNE